MMVIKHLKENQKEYQIKGLLFDLDGLLLDTEKTYQEGWLVASQALGVDLLPSEVSQWSGLSWLQTKAMLERLYGGEITAQLRQKREAYIYEQMISGAILIKEGATEILALAHQKGIKLALVTSTVSRRAIALLEKAGILSYFDVKIFGDKILQHKPLPQPYLAGLSELALQNDQVLAVEDSFTGALSATRADLSVFLVPDKSFDTPLTAGELSQLNLLAIGQNLYDLAEFI
jgi:HAD superfamily hydrolase (TIGR01509 family)